jgi:hypothetical protein
VRASNYVVWDGDHNLRPQFPAHSHGPRLGSTAAQHVGAWWHAEGGTAL